MPLVQQEALPPEADEGIQVSKKPSRRLLSAKWGSTPAFTDDVDEMIAREAEEDPPYSKTWTRRLVEGYFQHMSWYFPKRTAMSDDHPRPELTKAYAFYEHFTLARYLVDHGDERAEPGETRETRLYNPFTTPESSLNQWGIGVAVYFASLRIFAILLLIVGLINIANLVYWSSDEYSDGQNDVPFSLKGSAICTRGEFVACPECSEGSFTSQEEKDRFGTTDDGLIFVLRNACDYDTILNQGMVNYASLAVCVLFMGLISVYQRKRETIFDEDKLSATDYSLLVKNPPKGAFDPDDWQAFFSQFGKVTFVTVALDNGDLLWKLFIRRIFMNELRTMLSKGIDINDVDGVRLAAANLERELEAEPKSCIRKLLNCLVFPILRLFNYFLPPGVLFEKSLKLTEEIKELQKKEYNVTKVFVTFETEEAQRTALSALKVVSKLDSITNTARNNVPLFQTSSAGVDGPSEGTVLHVDEPKEPNAIRWQDIHISAKSRFIQRFVNFCLTMGLITLAGFLVARARESLGPQFSGPLVSIFNSTIPAIVKLLMMFERHHHEGSRQESLYLKITVFRWTNTAILTKIITPFTSMITNGAKDLLPTINAILWSELFIVPGLRLFDIMGSLKKHVLAPRAITQEQMNLSFQGTPYNLGERYTDFTKILFLCFFYSALFPGIFFFCGLILLVQYYMDKICLMRIWAPAPYLGTELAKFSRRYFFSLALVAFACVSSYAWAQFPYDNLCDPPEPLGMDWSGTYQITLLSNEALLINVTDPQEAVPCGQSWRDVSGLTFPATSSWQDGVIRWMTDSQVTLTDIYGWTTVAVVALFFVIVFGGTFLKFLVSFLRGTYKPRGMDMKIDFSTVPEISAYIPQIDTRNFPYPLLACDVDSVDKEFIGWTVADSDSYDRHNIIYDVPYEGMKRERETGSSHGGEAPSSQQEGKTVRPIFSIVKHWPPEWAREQETDEE